MERPATRQSGVPHQSLAQCSPGLSSLVEECRPGQHAVRSFCPRVADGQRQQFPRTASQFLSSVAEPSAAGSRQGGGAGVHGVPRENWPAERLLGTSLFFAKIGYKPTGEWKEEIVIFDPAKAVPQSGETPPVPLFPDGTAATLPPDQDPRRIFADWLITPQNPWFTRHIVNRLWYWLLGRGIVHEPDDIRAGNPPSNPELLTWLANELVAANYDLRHIYRLILNSRTYQLSCIPKSEQPQAAAHFACYPLRRLDAEVLIDALGQITGTTESYSSMIPEPFTFIPEDLRSIAPAGREYQQSLPRDVRPSVARHGTGVRA